jgi:ATP-dependent Clp protease ATP-binding subunit ClpC
LQKYIEDPLSEAVIQGSLPRPSALEIYLGEEGILYRPITEPALLEAAAPAALEAPATEGAPGSPEQPAEGTPLFTFQN